MRTFDATNYDVKVTVEAESAKSGLLDGLIVLFKSTGYEIVQTEERSNKLSWHLKFKDK